jgi:hypothetical protein
MNPVRLWGSGFILFGLGMALLAAEASQPFARWIGGKMPFLIDEADKPVIADFNDMTLGEVAGGFPGGELYTVVVAPDAGKVRVSGKYDARCSANLISRLCRKESQILTCDTDPTDKIIRVCNKANDKPCKDRTL